MTGYDESLAQTVHARRRYSLDEIVTDARFADAMTVREDGTRVIDYRRFHDTVPVERSLPGPR